MSLLPEDPTGTPTPGADSPSASPTGAAAHPAVEALQWTLAAEHAAVFVWAAVGAQTSASGTPRLYRAVVAAYETHRTRRDDLIAMIDRTGTEPVAAEPGYLLPAGLGTAPGNRAAARALEDQAAATYAYAVARTTGEHRAWATSALVDSAVRVLAFGAKPEVRPGI